MPNYLKKVIRIVAAIALVAVVWLTKPFWSNASSETVDLERKIGSLSLKPCSLKAANDSLSAFCGTLDVPENHAEPAGRKIRLSLAWVPATQQAEPDPIFLLAGGPGEAATRSVPMVRAAFAKARKSRNVVLVDQRGTGNSNPLKCKNEEGDPKTSEVPSEAKAKEMALACAKHLQSKAKVEHYTTSDAVNDLELVRAAMQADKINLYGISYGTRVAQQYAKKFPLRTRTITLDSVAPNEIILGMETSKNLQDSLNRQLARCSADKTCEKNLGLPVAQLETLLASLTKEPKEVNYRDITTGEYKTGKLTRVRIASLTRILAYVPQVATILPLLFHEANVGHSETVMALSDLISRDLEGMIAEGMQLSVMCSEDVPDFFVDPKDRGLLLGTALVELLKAQCEVWPHKERPADFRSPLTGSLPVLILSGEFDPVTPPRYGDIVAKHLQNARHIVAKGQGHGILPIGCMPTIFERFLEAADAKSLDTTCLDTLSYAPMFTGYYGWQP